jgi:NDP-sugar pyrophosphorylase family protein
MILVNRIMQTNLNIEEIDVVILCGGKGTRFMSVIKDCPKPMVEICNRPFLDILIEYIASYGFKRFVLCIGYMKDYIKQYYNSKRVSLEIVFSEEEELLGTGGAVKNAEPFIKSDIFLVANGDSFCPLNINKFVNFHALQEAEISAALIKSKNTGDYGSVVLDDTQRIISFNEKVQNEDGFVNGGVYLFNKNILCLIPTGTAYSLEYDFFPEIINRKFYGYLYEGEFVDIGTPERYEKAERFFEKFDRAGNNQLS